MKNIGPLSVFFFPEFFSGKKIEKFLESFSSVSLTNYVNFGGQNSSNFQYTQVEKKNPGLLSGCMLLCPSKENGQ